MAVERGGSHTGAMRSKPSRDAVPHITGMTPYAFCVVADLTGSLSGHRLSLVSTRGNTVVNAVAPFDCSVVAASISSNTVLAGSARVTLKPRVNGVVLTGSIQTSLRAAAKTRLYTNTNLTSYQVTAGQTIAVTIDTNTTANQFAAADDITIVLYTI